MKNKILAGAILLLSIATVASADPVGRRFDTAERKGTIELGGRTADVFVHQNGDMTEALVIAPGENVSGKVRIRWGDRAHTININPSLENQPTWTPEQGFVLSSGQQS